MSRRIGTLSLCAVLLSTTAVGVLWHQARAEQPPEQQPKPQVKLAATTSLGGQDRYLTHVSTDKPIYRPGEKQYIRATLLHHATNKPLPSDRVSNPLVEIIGPKGEVVASGYTPMKDSVIGFSWDIPATQPGGEYTIKVTHPFSGDAPAERKFEIRSYRPPRLKSQIKFLRDGYGPGDEAVATLHVERAEGGIPAGAPVTVVARVDGIEAHRGRVKVDDKGNCLARFKLPNDIPRGEGTLAMIIEDGGVVETASKTIPILLQTVDLTMYPEGGQLIASVPNRVYFEAFTPAKKPADLAGIVVDDKGQQVAEFRSEHEGRGRFEFSPQAGRMYHLQITEPSGIATRFPLPDVALDGLTLKAEQDRFAAGEKIRITVAATNWDKAFNVTLAKREQVVAVATALKGQETAEFQLEESDPSGVLIATAWTEDGQPLAERLIYRQPVSSIKVAIEPDQERYVPGGQAAVKILTTDAAGKPVSAIVGVTVTDESVLEMIEKREQAPQLPVMVLLEDDVREIADAHVYLDPDNADAPIAVDLLLGTQGWRRFAFVDSAKFLDQHADSARRVLALKMSARREILKLADVPKGFAIPADKFDAFRGEVDEELEQARRDAGVKDEKANGIPFPAAAPVAQAAVPVAEDPGAVPVSAEGKNAAPEPVVAPPAKEQAIARELQQNGIRARLADPRAKDIADALDRADDAERNARKVLGGRRNGRQAVRNDFVAVRVYAHQVRQNRKPNERIDFTETLCWHAGIRTSDEGVATIEFGLSDAVTSFRVNADAFSSEGALGAASLAIESVEPFYVEPKFPLEVTAGDQIRLPVGIVNATNAALKDVLLTLTTHDSLQAAQPASPTRLAAGTRGRAMIDITVGAHNGEASLELAADAGSYQDKVTRTIVVKPQGFPIEVAHGGLINPGDTVSHDVQLPEDFVRGSITTDVVVYPTPLASMTEALEGLIREPNGCFEQTSSTTYPLVMAQQYFMSHQGVDPTLVEKSSQILQTGYERLLGFECASRGFEWFGNDPGHDALTAYGLMEFTDMSRVMHVDPTMLERTRKWLLDQRDGKGGYARKTHTLHTWLPEPEIANAYNTWALLAAGVDADLATEIAWVRDAAERTENTYVMALAANVLALGGDKEGENHLLDKLSGMQDEDGSLKGATRSVVGSGGEALKIETTSLAVLAWLQSQHYAPQVEKSIKYLAESCKAGRFGSTQSTVLALKAIVAYDQSRAKPKATGKLQLVVDGKTVGEPVEFDEDTSGAIRLPAFAASLDAGKHQVQVVMTAGSTMPYSVTVNFHSLTPDSAEACKVHLHARLVDDELAEGDVTEAEVAVINRSNEDVPNPIAIIGIPGGLEVRHDQLKELVKQEKIAAYEVIGREVILYWRVLKAEERVDLPISCVAAVPGEYTGPASRTYLYYTDEHKTWTAGMQVAIAPKE